MLYSTLFNTYQAYRNHYHLPPISNYPTSFSLPYFMMLGETILKYAKIVLQ